jgi:hypothetical protein
MDFFEISAYSATILRPFLADFSQILCKVWPTVAYNLSKNNFSRKNYILADSSGLNQTKIIPWHILSHFGSNLCTKYVKSVLKMANLLGIFQKSGTMSRYFKEAVKIFLIYIFGIWGGSPTTPNREISWGIKFETFDLKTNRATENLTIFYLLYSWPLSLLLAETKKSIHSWNSRKSEWVRKFV